MINNPDAIQNPNMLLAQGVLPTSPEDGQVGTQDPVCHSAWAMGRSCETSQAGRKSLATIHEKSTSESSVYLFHPQDKNLLPRQAV